MLTWLSWFKLVAISSVLHSLLPPWDWDAAFLADFPRTQACVKRMLHNRWYKLFVTLVGFAAITLRSRVWSSISMPAQIRKMQNGNGDTP